MKSIQAQLQRLTDAVRTHGQRAVQELHDGTRHFLQPMGAVTMAGGLWATGPPERSRGVIAVGVTGPASLMCPPLLVLPRPSAGRLSAVTGPDDAVLVGVDGDLHPVAQAEFAEDAGDVALDGGLAEVKAGCDLGVGQALGDQPDDAEFAFAEVPGRSGRRGAGWETVAEVLDQPPGDGGGQEGFAGGHRADC
jgi:hypothetical protein